MGFYFTEKICWVSQKLSVDGPHRSYKGLTAHLPPILRHPTFNLACYTFLKSFFPILLFLLFEFLSTFIDLSGYNLWDIFRFISMKNRIEFFNEIMVAEKK